MSQYVRVVEDESLPAIELPTESDGNMLLSTLQAQFPGASGLRYKNPETDSWRGIRLMDNVLCPPADDGWGSHVYVVVQKNDSSSKRKIEESPNAKEPQETKPKMTKISTTAIPTSDQEIGDLIVLGLPWRATADDMKEYFQKFGEVTMTEVKTDFGSTKSRGFGFVNFKSPEVAKTVLSQAHYIQGRLCEVRLPRCRKEFMPKKLFVGRLPDGISEADLLEYFKQFGEVIDVYIPKPMRGISFITFASGDVAQKVQSQNHRLGGNLLNVSFAEPRSSGKGKNMGNEMQQMPPQGAMGGWGPMGFDMYGMGSWGNAGRHGMPYNAAAYNNMMQNMMGMGSPGAGNMMGGRHSRR